MIPDGWSAWTPLLAAGIEIYLLTQLSPDRSAAHFCPGGQSAIVFFGSVPLRERVPLVETLCVSARVGDLPDRKLRFLPGWAVYLKKTVLTNMGKLSYELEKKFLS